MKAVILAGGYATRLWPITKNRAKPLLMLNGKPLVSHIIDNLPKNIDVIIYTNSKFKADFDEWAEHWVSDHNVLVDCEKSRSEAKKLGAIGAIAECIKKHRIEEDVLIIGGDNYFGFNLQDFLKKYKGRPLLAAYDIGNLNEAKKFGVLKVAGKKVIDFKEKPENPNSTLVNTLCTVLPKSNIINLFDFVKKYSDNFGKFIEYLLTKTEIDAYISTDYWFDIGSFDGYLEAHKKLDRDSTSRGKYMGGDFYGENHLSGSVFIDKGTIIKNSKLKDCIILSNCEIIDSEITDSIIDESCVITKCKIKSQMIERGSRKDCKKGKCVIKR